MPKEKKPKKRSKMNAHNPLGQVLEEEEERLKFVQPKSLKSKQMRETEEEEEEEVEPLLDERTSRKILEMSREQQLEEDAEEMKRFHSSKGLLAAKKLKAKNFRGEVPVDDDDSEEEAEDELISLEEDDDEFETMEINRDDGYVTVHGEGLSAEEEAVVASMMGGRKSEERRTLADLILEKISEKEQQSQQQQQPSDAMETSSSPYPDLPPKVIEVYSDIGKILSRYKAGKLPKAFKVIPSLSNWEEVLYLTRPDQWTPNAMYAATRIFASNLNPKMAQRFYNLVLLDSVRADIVANHKLNYHYYMALKKAVYKPAAFFKGILLPLCQENCTLREAAIISSVMQRVSIPVHHSAVAIHKLAQRAEYNGAASIFIKTLLHKKYSLPAPVIGSMVKHFQQFIVSPEKMDMTLPVLWHQCLLVFVQRYKKELKEEAREILRQVMRIHAHPKITPEIRRELFGLSAWKEERVNQGEGGTAKMEVS